MKDVRPTSGRVLSALFSILGEMEGVSFLDLFSGTGRVGLEALERGASPVTMVEVLKDRAREIRLAIPPERAEKVTVLSLEYRRALTWLTKREERFDVVFADPPYNQGWGAELFRAKGLEEVLKQEGVMVVEHSSREALHVAEGWRASDVRTYGETTLTFVVKHPADPSRVIP